MPPPPPPPPPGPPMAPGPPPPPSGGSKPKASKSSGGSNDRGALLSQINNFKGAKLKKVQTNDRSAPSLGNPKPSGPGPGGPPMPGPGKFATVAARSSNSHSDLPSQWKGSQDDAAPVGGGAPMGLGGLFAGGIPRLPNKGAKFNVGGGANKGPAMKPPGRLPNGPTPFRHDAPMANGPSSRPGGAPPPPSASTKPRVNLHRTSSSGENLDRSELAPPPPPPSNKP